MSETITAIGLMSGTSMDGVDAALLETNGEGTVKPGRALSMPCPAHLTDLLWRAIEAAAGLEDRLARPEPLREAEREVTAVHAQAVANLLSDVGLNPAEVDVLGFHGQTILHRPERHLTVQLGDGAELARLTRIDVVSDFRANDMAHGGEGAPFAPVYHRALARSLGDAPVVFLNLGGVANVTWINGEEPLIAFDTGPANGLIDQWVAARTGRAMDEGGRLAAQGQVDETVLAQLMQHPYFDREPPKSLDRFDFSLGPLAGLGDADGAATLIAFTAASVARAAAQLPEPPRLWVACGGGRHNPELMSALAAGLNGDLRTAEDVGLRGDSIEAEAFAYMAARSLKGLPLSFPSTTGVAEPVTGGVLHRSA